MTAKIVPVDAVHPDAGTISSLGDALRAGDLVAFPTETVYGLGADATNAAAVAEIFRAKGRPASDPLIVHLASVADLAEVTGRSLAESGEVVQQLAEAFWPGPLTLIVPRGPRIPENVAAGRATVGVRVPAHPVAHALISAAGVPIAAPSANRFGHTSPTTAAHVFTDLSEHIPWILDGGSCTIGIESTILDVTQTPPVLLRPGGVSVEAIEAVIGTPIIHHERQAIAPDEGAVAPGMLLSHYAPRARLLVFESDDVSAMLARMEAETRALIEAGNRVGVLIADENADRFRALGAQVVASLGASADLESIARSLFAGLRLLDDAGVEVIVTRSFRREGLGLALRDRLWRAAGGTIIPV